jgi:GH25 family lysozyme M1 (1,4-beta-N-acetylmuramidase)
MPKENYQQTYVDIPNTCLFPSSDIPRVDLWFDVSDHQGEIDWPVALNISALPISPNIQVTVDGVYVRASYGLTNDTQYEKNNDAFLEYEYLFNIDNTGIYHALLPGDPCDKQAEFFYSKLIGTNAARWMLDVELDKHLDPWPEMTECVETFLETIKKIDPTTYSPWIYTNPYSWNPYFDASKCEEVLYQRGLWMAGNRSPNYRSEFNSVML